MLLIYRNIILLQIKEKHATTSTSRTTTKVHPSLKNKRGSTEGHTLFSDTTFVIRENS